VRITVIYIYTQPCVYGVVGVGWGIDIDEAPVEQTTAIPLMVYCKGD